MKNKKLITVLMALVLSLTLCACGERVTFSQGKVFQSKENVKIVVQSGETALLDKFPQLKSVDLRGSTCYQEIIDWAAAHPGVSVKYDVTMPDGSTVENDAQSADLSGLTGGQLLEAQELFSYLPRLTSVDITKGEYSAEDVYNFYEAAQGISFDYQYVIGTKQVDFLAQDVDLTGITPDEAKAAESILPYLPQLKTVELGDEDSSGLGLDQITELCASCDGKDISFHYAAKIGSRRIDFADRRIDLTGLTPDEAKKAETVLPYLNNLEEVELGDENTTPLSWEQLSALVKSNPDAAYNYKFTLYGKEFSMRDTKMDLNHTPIDDGGELVYQVLGCMNKLNYLDMDFCGVDNESMARIRDAYPNVKVVWRVWFGAGYTCRTDTEKILASKPTLGGMVTDADAAILKYCTDVKYLDLGHNETLSDVSFLAYMPKLEVAVLAMENIYDISPIANCKNLEYLEIQTNPNLTDISPLGGLTGLHHLNIARCPHISDITPLYNLKELERCWIGFGNDVPQEQIDKLQELLPNCRIDTTVYDDPTGGNWRVINVDSYLWKFTYDPRYELLCQQFGYLEGDYSVAANDPKYYGN